MKTFLILSILVAALKSVEGHPYCHCTAWGDPHIRTFDNAVFSFQSYCRFLFAGVPHAPGNCGFRIESQSYHRGRNLKVSWVQFMVIKMFGENYHLFYGPIIRVNGRNVRNYHNQNVRFYISGRTATFDAPRCGVKLTWHPNGGVNIYVLRSKYSNKVNGLCGTCDGNPTNDWRTRTGVQIPQTKGLYNGEAIARSWAVPDFGGRICQGNIAAPPLPVMCVGAVKTAALKRCHPLLINKAVFKVCTDKGILKTEYSSMYKRCIEDACALGRKSHLGTKLSCQVAQLMADTCLGRGVPVPNWRKVYNCPAPVPPKPQDPCSLPAIKGPCRASHTRFYFNKETGSCQYFIYGGCGGNVNRFQTYTDCIQECGGKKKASPTDCSGNELTVALLQKLRALVTEVARPDHDMSYLVRTTKMMEQVTLQFQVIMKLFIGMQRLKQQRTMLEKYMNLRQLISQLFMIVKKGINRRHTIVKNPILIHNTNLITRVINGYKIIKNVYTGHQKTQTFVTTFDKVHIHDNAEIYKNIFGIVSSHLETNKIDALKVLVPTYVMSNMEKLSQFGFKGDVNLLQKTSTTQLKRIQTIATAVQKKVIVKKELVHVAIPK